MVYVDVDSLLLGFVGGIAAACTVAGFTVLAVTEITRRADRRKLSEKRGSEYPSVSELLREHRAALPVVAPHRDSAPATTAAGTRRSRSAARSNALQTLEKRSSRAGRVPNGVLPRS